MQSLLVRHGSCASCGPLLAGRTAGIDLDATGRAQAAALAAALACEPVAAVYASPLARAMQTAHPIAAAHGLEPVPRDAFLELDYGAWTGRTFEELAPDPQWQAYNRSRSVVGAPGGESVGALQARAVAELLRLRPEYEHDTIVVVAHAEVVRTVVAWCLGVPLDLSLRIAVAPASLTRIRWYADSVSVEGVNAMMEGA